jgi:hypothetical protein
MTGKINIDFQRVQLNTNFSIVVHEKEDVIKTKMNRWDHNEIRKILKRN